MRDSLQVFSAKIYRVGIVRYVDVPEDVSREIAAGKVNVAVRGTVEGLPVRTTLVPRGRGCHRLAIHGEIRKKLRVDTGAVVEVALERDEESREPAVPPALSVALRLSAKAQGEYRAMTTALRREVVRFILGGKQEATRERRVAKMVRVLEKKAEKRKRRAKTSRR
jgi:Domain of unknown function (DUF1905)/Bacteriocin-protection, YdeI or OmpD-Associated